MPGVVQAGAVGASPTAAHPVARRSRPSRCSAQRVSVPLGFGAPASSLAADGNLTCGA